jgi:hypothetical protein
MLSKKQDMLMRNILKISAMTMIIVLVNGCAGGASKSGQKGRLCQTKPSNAICASGLGLKPVGTTCYCTHYDPFGGSKREKGVVIR